MSPNNHADADDSRELTPIARIMRRLPRREPSPDLEVRLRILASKESARRKSRVTWRQLWLSWASEFAFGANNLMRPLAIPTAGGFVSALLLFGVLAQTMATRGVAGGHDVPTALYTEASVRSFKPLGFHNEALTVEVTIDSEGRVIDYSIQNSGPDDYHLQRSIENYLLFTQFTPVRNFGQPVTAKVTLSFQSSHIDVRG